MRKKTHDQWLQDFNKIHKNVFNYPNFLKNPLNEGSNTKIDIECKIHGVWSTSSIQNHKKGSGCPKCKNLISSREGEVLDIKGLGKVEILIYRKRDDIDVKFQDDTIIRKTSYKALMSGNIKNYNNVSVENKGFLGFGRFNTVEHKKLYYIWRDMLKRCYKGEQSSYKDCEVIEEWYNFQNFAKWANNNYNPETMKGWHLDKDILVEGNKVYSPETCCFVPPQINSIFIKRVKNNNSTLTGVRGNKNNTFYTRITKKGKPFIIGVFDTPDKAFEAYKTEKEKYIKEIAEEWKDKIDEKVYKALYNYEIK